MIRTIKGKYAAKGDYLKPDNDNLVANWLKMDPKERLKAAASLDREDMWTCTPGSLAEVPENDPLLDRKEDPFQLKDISSKDAKAGEL